MMRSSVCRQISIAKSHGGFSRLELMAGVLVIGVLVAILLDKLVLYQELAEKARMEFTISRIISGLRLRMAGMLMAGRAQEYSTLVNDIPMDWLDEKPVNYAGEVSAADAVRPQPGNWYFDKTSRMLIYSVQHSEHFESGGNDRKEVRLKVILRHNRVDPNEGQSGAGDPTDSVSIELAEAYRWF